MKLREVVEMLPKNSRVYIKNKNVKKYDMHGFVECFLRKLARKASGEKKIARFMYIDNCVYIEMEA